MALGDSRVCGDLMWDSIKEVEASLLIRLSLKSHMGEFTPVDSIKH